MSEEPAFTARRQRKPRGFKGLSPVVRVLIITAAAIVILYLLFFHVFPWLEVKVQDPTLEGASVPAIHEEAGQFA